MFDLFLKEFDLSIMEANDIFESASDILALEVTELELLEEQGYFEESADDNDNAIYEASVEKFLEGIQNFFKKIKEAIVKFAKDVRNKVNLELTKRDVNKKIKYIKKMMATKRRQLAIHDGKKFPFFDYVKYMKAYKKYTNHLVKELNYAYKKDYKTREEFESTVSECNKRLIKTAKDLNLYEAEVYVIDVNVHTIVDNSEKAANDIEKIVKLYNDEASRIVETAESATKQEEDITKISMLKNIVNRSLSDLTRMTNMVIRKIIGGINHLLSVFSGLFKKENK